MRTPPTILQVIEDENLFGPWFKDPSTWTAWHTCLKAMFGLPMTDADLAIYKECTGRTKPPTAPVSEAWLCVGRRSGKSFITALVAVFLATIRDWTPYLIPGERGVIAVVAVSRSQSRIIFNYCRALLNNVPLLAPLIENETADTIDLTNGITISIGTNTDLKRERIETEAPNVAKAITNAEASLTLVTSAHASVASHLVDLGRELPDPEDGADAVVGDDGMRQLSGSQYQEALGHDG